MVVAALLHDAVEDEGGLARLDDIEANFGKQVGKIVMRRSRTQKLLVFRALPIDWYEARVTRVSGQNRSLIN
jgi:(p)ppGpp synthase/HD superfamily hydrolase